MFRGQNLYNLIKFQSKIKRYRKYRKLQVAYRLQSRSGGIRGGGGEAERAEARGPTNLHFSKSFFFDKKCFRILKKVFICKNYTKIFKILALKGFGGKCDVMLLVNSVLIFISKNLLKVRIAVVIS